MCVVCVCVCVCVLGLKKSVLDEKNSIFAQCAIHMCSNKLREKKLYFPKSCSIFEIFSLKNNTKYCKKSNTWHVHESVFVAYVYVSVLCVLVCVCVCARTLVFQTELKNDL